MKPEKPITRKEMYLDVATGGSTELPSPVTREEKYLAKIAGESVDVPTPVTRYEMLLAAVAGQTYTLSPVTRLEIYLAKAAGQDVEIPQPVTREEMYWFDYCGGTPTPPEREYTGAVPVTFVADGTPLLDYIISGNTVQNGTPTPDNPIVPQCTGERTGNVMPAGKLKTVESNGVTFSSDGKGKYTINGTATAYASARFNLLSAFTTPISVSNGGQGTLSFFNTSADNNVTFVFCNGTTKVDDWKQTPISRSSTAYNAIGNKYVDSVIITVNSGATVDITITPEFTNDGVLPETYEPYGYKIPISSANTTTPVYLGQVSTVRRIKCVDLGTLTYTKTGSGNFKATLGDGKIVGNSEIAPAICSHFKVVSANDYATTPLSLCAAINAQSFVSINKTGFEEMTVGEFKSAMSGVLLWYALQTEQTGIVNEPLMRIGDYADTLSMEQAGAQIPTANGSTTLDVETTVPPSEIYIKYRGEAVATLSSLPAEVSSPEETPEEVNPEETEETENGSEDVSLQHEFEAIE